MKSSLSITQLKEFISRFLHRFHVILFVVLVVGGLSLVTAFLNQAITKPSSDVTDSTEQPFDKETMEKINNLHTTNEQTSLNPPNGRINPFLP